MVSEDGESKDNESVILSCSVEESPLTSVEVRGIVDEKVISPEEICELFAAKPEEMTLVCTGRVLDEKIREAADEVYNIAPEK